MSLVVSTADPDDLVALTRLLDAALLDVGAATVERQTAAGETLRADRDGRLVGVLVRDGALLVAVAVRNDHRRTGVGRALVERAAAEARLLVADCRPAVAGFYRACGFRVTERDGRAYGVVRVRA